MRGVWKRLAAAAATLLVATTITAGTAVAQSKEVRIGYQKYGTLVFVKSDGKFEQKLKAQGFTVKWTEFPGGPQLLEALNVGALDLGTVGEAPPVFAQAAGAPLLYVGYEPPAPKAEAILVPKNSPITSVAQLKGKKVALNKGSNVHYLLVKALEEAGLKYTDIETVFLAPADARAAFERGSVDAWVIWDPFQAAAEAQIGARTLRDGVGIVANHQFYVASKNFNTANPLVVDALVEAIAEIDVWVQANQKKAAADFAPDVGLPAAILEVAVGRLGFGVKPLNDQVVADQQKLADTFFELGLIPTKISIKDAVRPVRGAGL